MDCDEQRPDPPPRNFVAKSMSALGDTLAQLVDRMEAEVAQAGTVTAKSAGELRSLRVQAELFFGVHAKRDTDT